MYGQVLVTPTLLDGFDWMNQAPYTWKKGAKKGFIEKLSRAKADYPKWVYKGEDFEKQVVAVCETSKTIEEINIGSDLFQQVCKACYGGTFQTKLKKTLMVDGHKAFFFGYSDVDFPKLTVDLKTCVNWKTKSKYLDKNQHIMYLWMNGKEKFKYVVVEWADEALDSTEIKSVHEVDYTSPGQDILERMIIQRTEKMFAWLHDNKQWDTYYYTFSKN